jgi:hypothetical protein
VCPFAQPALDQDTLRIAVVRLTETDKRTQIIDAVNFHLKAFIAAPGTLAQRMLRAVVVLFPDVSVAEAPDLIDQVKEDLKGGFIEQGLMLGEFHAGNDSPGLHNQAFKPLRSPIPMLAIRHLVWSDISFLNRPEYSVDTRLKYLEAYVAAPNVPETSRKEAERLLAALKYEACKLDSKSVETAQMIGMNSASLHSKFDLN